jgi:hypothetical protein
MATLEGNLVEGDIGRPIPPDPSSFGIDAKYFEIAVEGARAWAERKRLPRWAKWLTRGALVCTLGAIGLYADGAGTALGLILAFGLLTLLLAEGVIHTLEEIRGRKLKRTVFDPRYNPNPEAYRRYAAEYANYESQLAEVFLSDYWVYHSNRDCCGMRYRWSMGKWQAIAKGARPCTNCGHLLRVPPRRELPRPFGTAFLPEELQKQEEAFEKREQMRREAQKRMDVSTAKMVEDIQRRQERQKLKEIKRRNE